MFGSRVGLSGSADQTALHQVGSNKFSNSHIAATSSEGIDEEIMSEEYTLDWSECNEHFL